MDKFLFFHMRAKTKWKNENPLHPKNVKPRSIKTEFYSRVLIWQHLKYT